MPRSRSDRSPRAQRAPRITASASQGSGYSSGGFLLPPLAVLIVGCLLAAFVNSTSNPTLPVAAASSDSLSPIFTREVQYWGNQIIGWSGTFNLDPNLAAAVMQIESCGDPRAVSRAGAMGLFQVMPFHFYATDDPYNPSTNAQRGLDYLARSLERAGGNPRLALAGYNGGIGLIGSGEWSWPAETKRYVQYGAPIYEDARAGLTFSEALNEWYVNYGASLCRQAAQRLGL